MSGNSMPQFLSRARCSVALANRRRLQLVTGLAKRPARMNELAGPYGMSAIAISKHIVVLEKAGIVRRQREGTVQNCVLNTPVQSGVESRIGAYRHNWTGQFDGLAKFVDTQGRGNC